ncbi:MAG: hypothetical protein RIB30_14860 [Thalassospira sp.]
MLEVAQQSAAVKAAASPNSGIMGHVSKGFYRAGFETGFALAVVVAALRA